MFNVTTFPSFGTTNNINNNSLNSNKYIQPQKINNDSFEIQNKNNNIEKTDATIEYAKEKVISALKSENPHEYEVIINKNKVIKEIAGDKANVPLNGFGIKLQMYNTDNKITTVHGHPTQPDGTTPPISVQDFQAMNKLSGEHKCIVYNEYGKYSILTKKDSYKELSKDEFKKIDDEFMKYLFISLPEDEKMHWIQLIKETQSNPEKFSEVDRQLSEKITDYQLTKEGAKAVHKFWLKNAESLNLDYKTNFEGFN